MPIINEQILLSEIQVILAEKRTYYSFIRTGIAVATVPFTIIAFLIITSPYHGIFENYGIGAIVIGILFLISMIGIQIVYISSNKVKKLSQLIKEREKADERVDDILI